MSGQRIAAIVALGILALIMAGSGVQALTVSACTGGDIIGGYIPMGCIGNAPQVRAWGYEYLMFAVAAVAGAVITYLSRPKQ